MKKLEVILFIGIAAVCLTIGAFVSHEIKKKWQDRAVLFAYNEFPRLSPGELSSYCLRVEGITKKAGMVREAALVALQKGDLIGAEKKLLEAHGYLSEVLVPISARYSSTEAIVNYRILYHDISDKLAAIYIDLGRVKDANNILLDVLMKDAMYQDNGIIRRWSFRTFTDLILRDRYLSTVDTISLFIRLGQRLNMPQAQMAQMLAPYTNDINSPETFQEYVITLEYRLAYSRLQGVERLLNRFKRYLHANFGYDKQYGHYGYIFYYPYLMGRFLLASDEYEKAAQYLKIALEIRPEYDGIVSSDLIDAYQRMGRNEEARALAKPLLSSLRYTSGYMFFKSQYERRHE